jgi:hypothetical protein
MRISYKGGYILILQAVIFIAIAIVIGVGMINPILSDYASIRAFTHSKQAFLAADSTMNEAFYRFKTGKNMPPSITLDFASSSATVNVIDISGGKRLNVVAESSNFYRETELDLQFGTGVSFHYGIQTGRGGFEMNNSSSIIGNVFSSGPISGSGNMIYGDVISASTTGLVDGIHATGTIMAHTIKNSTADKDAYYMVRTNTTVGGTAYPNSPDQDDVPMPISDAQIAEWEGHAEAGGIFTQANCDSFSAVTNTCTLTTSKAIGPVKIPFNLKIKSSSAVITLRGQVWVVGNITTETGPKIKMDPLLGPLSVAFIADDPANRASKGVIDVGQTTVFEGNSGVRSYIFMISQNNSAENGGGRHRSAGPARGIVYGIAGPTADHRLSGQPHKKRRFIPFL